MMISRICLMSRAGSGRDSLSRSWRHLNACRSPSPQHSQAERAADAIADEQIDQIFRRRERNVVQRQQQIADQQSCLRGGAPVLDPDDQQRGLAGGARPLPFWDAYGLSGDPEVAPRAAAAFDQ